jgi:hypothetical protein
MNQKALFTFITILNVIKYLKIKIIVNLFMALKMFLFKDVRSGSYKI